MSNKQHGNIKLSVKERFEKFVMPEPNTGCWLWSGSCSGGYGMISINGHLKKASRVSYSIHKGTIPEGLIICHSCDNTYCVNPDHLFAGTHQDNMTDKVNKGRHRSSKGENNPSSKLNKEIVLQILQLHNMHFNICAIATKLGTHNSNVSNVIYGRTWSHISGIKDKYSKVKKAKN